MAGKISMGARREVVSVVAERYRSVKRAEKGRILDELCATTGWHRKHAVRALRKRDAVTLDELAGLRARSPTYGATIKDALTALWEASDRVCGKRLKAMIATLLPALERHGRLNLDKPDRDRILAVSAATIDRMFDDAGQRAYASVNNSWKQRCGAKNCVRTTVSLENQVCYIVAITGPYSQDTPDVNRTNKQFGEAARPPIFAGPERKSARPA